MAKKQSSEVVHVGIDYNEAIASKKEMLLTQVEILSAIKHMRSYGALRKKEFIIKNKLKRTIKEISTALKHIESSLPKEDQIKIIRKTNDAPIIKEATRSIEEIKEDQEEKIQKQQEQFAERQKNMQIEDELAEIQAKLAELE